jgi:steroid 5-alpha reductase family enzyme
MDLGTSILVASVTIFVYMNLIHALSVLRKNAGIVDIAWGFGFVLVAFSLFNRVSVTTSTQNLILLLITLWGLRLSYHIARRNLFAPEDWRYAHWRQNWGKTYAWRSYLQIFMLQGLMMLVISSSTIVVFASEQEPSIWLELIGAGVWSIGYIFEVIGDKQLADFIKNKKSGKTEAKIMTKGLWRYTRHPNYFGEVTQWWGIWLIVSGLPWGWLALISPLTITILILYVSGMPLLEKKYSQDKQWQVYAKQTSKFFPRLPKTTR